MKKVQFCWDNFSPQGKPVLPGSSQPPSVCECYIYNAKQDGKYLRSIFILWDNCFLCNCDGEEERHIFFSTQELLYKSSRDITQSKKLKIFVLDSSWSTLRKAIVQISPSQSRVSQELSPKAQRHSLSIMNLLFPIFPEGYYL